jgi:hypothetical protein
MSFLRAKRLFPPEADGKGKATSYSGVLFEAKNNDIGPFVGH